MLSSVAVAPVKPLLADFLGCQFLGMRGTHFSSFLMFAIMHPCHLLAVISETDLEGPSFFSSIIKGLSCPALEVMMAVNDKLVLDSLLKIKSWLSPPTQRPRVVLS